MSENWAEVAHALSGLAMFDVLPALDGIDKATRERVLQAGRSALAPGAFRRIDFATLVVATKTLRKQPPDLPDAQVEDARRYLVNLLKPTASQAQFSAFSSIDAAATRAIDEIRVLTAAINTEFSGSIYKQGGAYKFTAAVMGGADWSPSHVPIPRGVELVASYHSHPPANANAENFSPQDIMICRGIKDSSGNVIRLPVVMYVGTPSGHIKKLTPPALLKGADAEAFSLLGKQEILR